MARLIKSEVETHVSMVSNFIHDDESVEQVKCKIGDKVTVNFVLEEEVKSITGIVKEITLDKNDLKTGAQIDFTNVPFYKTSTTNAVSFRRNGIFYVWSGSVENGRIRVTNMKNNIGNPNKISGWVNVDDIKYGIGYDFNKEVKPSMIMVDASEEFDSKVYIIPVFEIVEITVVEEATEDNTTEEVTPEVVE